MFSLKCGNESKDERDYCPECGNDKKVLTMDKPSDKDKTEQKSVLREKPMTIEEFAYSAPYLKEKMNKIIRSRIITGLWCAAVFIAVCIIVFKNFSESYYTDFSKWMCEFPGKSVLPFFIGLILCLIGAAVISFTYGKKPRDEIDEEYFNYSCEYCKRITLQSTYSDNESKNTANAEQ